MNGWLQTHAGVISARALREMGCPARTIDRLVARGELRQLLPGVYLSAQWPVGRDQRLMACCLRNPAAVIAFTTAAQLWRMRGVPDRGVHLLVPHGSSPQMEGIHVHRCRRIDDVDVVTRADGLRLTSPPRTLFDAADMLGADTTASIVEQLLDEQRCTFATLADTVNRLGHPRRPGTRTLTEVLRSRPAWRQAMQSDLEVRVMAALRHVGLPEPVPQVHHVLPSGAAIRFDFAWPRWKVAVEVDHPFWHSGAAQSHLDKTRDRQLATQGWLSLRITSTDVASGLHQAVTEVADALHSRGMRSRRQAA
jgi:hypothetical protein